MGGIVAVDFRCRSRVLFAELLGEQGILVARRTIAKYREELKISTSNQRKILY